MDLIEEISLVRTESPWHIRRGIRVVAGLSRALKWARYVRIYRTVVLDKRRFGFGFGFEFVVGGMERGGVDDGVGIMVVCS